ncbi:T9SS type A sorting domain-containing protein [Pontibacter sp. SGAir0037]|uniref:T9SS type A sorting domain-containing protein n=1 Tax=Pontibacter sp. SGAir0037 TaxID=2571030 RepID=UPI0010CD0D8A|nr:T9SS type A sorting domain-containing protein [Pontibacter sp. SGAir0037]QCR23169.1 hypothetical protein C1N53_12995 [Pontibacter sp. SGAir0037]
MRFLLVLLGVWLLCCYEAAAQVVLSPLQQEVRQPDTQQHSQVERRMANALSLPFFDDFATSAPAPDPGRWINGGVYINNRFGRNPITKNVASFDGLNAAGEPYAPNSVAPGPSDTLTSQPVLLGNLNPADSVYLSFYWQSGGNGDIPNRDVNNNIFLQLEFKDASGNWQAVWRQQSVGIFTEFAQVFVAVKNQQYFHNAFQFRFRAAGMRTGMLDTWNLDYVELGSNRRKGQVTTRDIGLSGPVSRLLKNYTAMPIRQFLENPENELAETISARINNLGDFPGAITWSSFVKRVGAGATDTFETVPVLLPALARQYEISSAPRLSQVPLPEEHFVLEHGFRLNTREQNQLQLANDSTTRKTVIADYYAFDDGTAEGGYSYVAGTQVAQRIVLNRPDQVRGFRVYFPRAGVNLAGTSIAFRIWSDNNGIPGAMVHQEAFQVQYTAGFNEFYEVIFAKPVRVSDVFYIGWNQPSGLFLNIGFDVNEPATGRYIGSVSGWQEDPTVGAVMLRPLLTGIALGLEEELAQQAIQLYPNPSSGNVFVEGDYKRLVVYDILGREVYTYRPGVTKENFPLDLRHLGSGAYMVRIETSKTVITKKLILSRP